MDRGVHPRLAVSAICSWNLGFDEDLALWAGLGIGHVGLYLEKMELAEGGVARTAASVRDRGLSVSTLACRGFDLFDRDSWPERWDSLRPALDAAANVGARCLFVTAGAPGPLGFDECVDALGEALEPLRAPAAELGVPLAVEHTNPMRRDIGFVHSLRDMVEVARRLDVGVVFEVTNCWYERGLEATIAGGAETIVVAQVSDYLVGTVTATERAVPGDGDIPLARIIGLLDAAGFDGPFELEMLGPRVEDEGYGPAIARAVAALEPMIPTP
jgi:sugar phosphate isomerase/epimerase